MRVRSVISLSLSMIVAGCAIRPLPKNVTRDTTFSIVEKIRCEARDALISQIIDEFARSIDPRTRALAPLLESGELSFLRSEDWVGQVDADTIKKVRKFQYSGITYEFTFTITENNNKTGNASFKLPFTKGIFALGLKAGAEKKRKNERIFEISESFGKLVEGNDEEDEMGLGCDFIRAPRKHWIYPITGKIGLEEVIDTFIELVNVKRGIKTMSDELEFTTKLLGQIKPSVSLDKLVPKQLRLVSADIDANADRTDIHKVKISLVFNKNAPVVTVPVPIRLGAGVNLVVQVPKVAPTRLTTMKKGDKKPSGKLFTVTPNEDEMIRKQGIIELRRLDSLTRQRDLNDLIGR